MSNNRRTQRIAQLVRAELARILMEDISDPALVGVSVTDVRLNNDFKSAHVFYSLSQNASKPKEILRGFERAIPYMRRKLGDNLELRYVPTLAFELDTQADDLTRLYGVMDEVSGAVAEKTTNE